MTTEQNDRADHIDTVLEHVAQIADRPWDADSRSRRESLRPPTPLLSDDSSWWRRLLWLALLRRGDQRRVPVFVSVAVVLVAAGLGTYFSLSDSSPPAEPPLSLPAAATVRESSAARAPDLVVDVVGKVANPGLRTLPDGARVADAVAASGGALPGTDVSTLNLARKVVDGEQIHVGVPAPQGTPTAPGAPPPVDLNSATVAQLDTLPGVGSVTAQRILDWRGAHGRFSRIEQLREVDGIGPARFNSLRELVVVR